VCRVQVERVRTLLESEFSNGSDSPTSREQQTSPASCKETFWRLQKVLASHGCVLFVCVCTGTCSERITCSRLLAVRRNRFVSRSPVRAWRLATHQAFRHSRETMRLAEAAHPSRFQNEECHSRARDYS
jgi:hypothetical protein